MTGQSIASSSDTSVDARAVSTLPGTLEGMPSRQVPDPARSAADGDAAGSPARITPHQIARLAELRAGLRDYLAWAEEEARRHDTTPMQFQLVLAIRSSNTFGGPTVSELAATLRLKHHSVVGLIDRAEAVGLVQRERDAGNAARVRVSLTRKGAELLESLAARHQQHLTSIAQPMSAAWAAFDPLTT